MIEQLSRIEPAGSSTIAEMQGGPPQRTLAEQLHAEAMADAARRQACTTCRGRRGRQVGNDWIWCPACAGSGRRRDESRRSSTRPRVAGREMPTAAVLAATAGMPARWYRAAVVLVCADPHSARLLEREVRRVLVEPRARGWQVAEAERERRLSTLARLAAGSLALEDGQSLAPPICADLLGVTRKTWHVTWKPRYRDLADAVRGWAMSADDWMIGQVRGLDDELATMTSDAEQEERSSEIIDAV